MSCIMLHRKGTSILGPLYEAAADIVQFLLGNKRVDLDALCMGPNRNPIFLALNYGHYDTILKHCFRCMMQEDVRNPDAKGFKGRTPLSYAVQNSDYYEDACRELICNRHPRGWFASQHDLPARERLLAAVRSATQ